MPHTGYVPPERYGFSDHKLIRHGALSAYIKDPVTFEPTPRDLAGSEARVSTGNNADAAVGCLTKALAAIDLSAAPKIDLSCAGSMNPK